MMDQADKYFRDADLARIRELESELAAIRQQNAEAEALLSELTTMHQNWTRQRKKLQKELAALRQQQGEPVAYLRDDGDGGLEFSAPGDGFAVYREAAPKQQGKPVAVVSDESDYDFRQYLKCAEHLPFGTKLYREAALEHAHADDISEKRVAETAKNKHEPVAEIVLESMGVPGSDAMQARIHFFKKVPPPGTKLYLEAAPRVPEMKEE